MKNDLGQYFKKHAHDKIKISVSGAAETGHCGLDATEKALELGKEIVRQGCVLVTGATTGFPLWASRGAKEAGGFTVGFSPGKNKKDHVENFKLPLDYLDIIVYTGAGYPERDIILTRASDAVICGCGRVGTLHEFLVAFESDIVIGILEDKDWNTDETIKTIIERGNRPNPKVIFEPDPKVLIEKVVKMVKEYKLEL